MASTTSNSDVCASNSKPRNLPDDDLIRGFLLSLGTTCLSPANPTTNPRPSPGRACKFVGELPASLRKNNISECVIAERKFSQFFLNAY